MLKITRLSIFAAFVFVACEKQFPDYWVSNLHAGLTPDSAISVLEFRDGSVRIIEDRKLAPGDRRPAFDKYAIEIEISDLGEKGTLRIAFLNGSLTSAIFFPTNMKGYLDSLMKIKEVDLINNSDGKVGPKTRIKKRVDHRGKPYIQWEDIPGSRKIDKWINRYSMGGVSNKISFSV